MDKNINLRLSLLLIILISLPLLAAMRKEEISLKLNFIPGVLVDIFIPIVEKSTGSLSPTANPSEEPINPTPSDEPINPTPTPSDEPTNPTPTSTIVPEGMILVDHRSVALFDDIPAQYLDAAKNLRMLFSDRSVGGFIDLSLDCLTATSWAESLSRCRTDYYDEWNYRTFTQEDLDQGLVPERILFDPDPQVYDRSNWTFEYRSGDWTTLTQDFIEGLAPLYLDTKDVLSYQFSYLNVSDSSDIASLESGFFADNPDKYDIYDLEEFISEHADKTFIFWTSSLARSIGTQVSMDFNNQMRQYAIEHNKILFDVADIEAHTDLGEACYDNRDGVEYCQQNSGECENYPDDGLDLPAICQDWTPELDGGHFDNLAGGKIAIAKAFWVLMAQIAGWVP